MGGVAEHFDPEDMAAREVYGNWAGDEDLQDLRAFHAELVRFVERTAAEGSALLILVG